MKPAKRIILVHHLQTYTFHLRVCFIIVCSFLLQQFFLDRNSFLCRIEEDQIRDNVITEMAVDDPVHELEASEGDGEEDAAVLVDVRCGHSKKLVQVLGFAVGICRCWWRRGRQGHWHWWGSFWRHWRWWSLHVISHEVTHLDSRRWSSSILHSRCQVRAYGSLLTLVVHAQVIHLEVNGLK